MGAFAIAAGAGAIVMGWLIFSRATRLANNKEYESRKKESSILFNWIERFRADTRRLMHDKFRLGFSQEPSVPEWLSGYVVHADGKSVRKDFFNIAIAGRTGVGKSSIINRLRGFNTRQEAPENQWATTGVAETTLRPRTYGLNLGESSSCTTKILLWDLPGMDSTRLWNENYTETLRLMHFDLVLIVSAGGCRESDLTLHHELKRLGVPSAFVYNKVDVDVKGNLADADIPEEETLLLIRKDWRSQGIADLFVVASKGHKQYDVPQLIKTIHAELERSLTRSIKECDR